MLSEDRNMAIAIKLAAVGENPAKAVTKAMDTPEQLTNEDMYVLTSLQLANYYHKSRNEMLFGMVFGTDTHLFSTPETNAVSTIHEILGTPHGFALWEEWAEDSDGGPWANGAPITRQSIEKLLKGYSRPDSVIKERFNKVHARKLELGD